MPHQTQATVNAEGTLDLEGRRSEILRGQASPVLQFPAHEGSERKRGAWGRRDA